MLVTMVIVMVMVENMAKAMAIITETVVDGEMGMAVEPDTAMAAVQPQQQTAGIMVIGAMVGAILGSKPQTFTVILN